MPSIVVGIVAYALVVLPMRRFSALRRRRRARRCIMIPILAAHHRGDGAPGPGSLREASLALGVPQLADHASASSCATALGGIVTGVLLAVARAAGETAPLLFTALNNQYWNCRPRPADGLAAGPDLHYAI